LASAAAGYLSALIAQLAATETIAGQVLDPAKALATYNDVFTTIALWGTGIGAALLVMSPILGRLDQPVEKLKPQAAE
jgi:POT family proton-dependent oligopeptide transporter